MSFQNKQVVIIGGSSGIGLATAYAFAQAGASVTITGRSADKLTSAREHLALGQLKTYVLDGQDGKAVAAFFHSQGPIDHLILSAGGPGAFGPLRAINEETLRGAFDRKFWIQILAAHHGIATLCEGGSLTLVTAVTALRPTPNSTALAAINGALNAIVSPLALEIAPLRVNAVAPGIIDTPSWSNMPAQARAGFFKSHAASLPVKQIGKPEDVADAILFLAGNQYITGVVLPVDGGFLLIAG